MTGRGPAGDSTGHTAAVATTDEHLEQTIVAMAGAGATPRDDQRLAVRSLPDTGDAPHGATSRSQNPLADHRELGSCTADPERDKPTTGR